MQATRQCQMQCGNSSHVRVLGPPVSEASMCSNGGWSKLPSFCGAQCGPLDRPSNIKSCELDMHHETFSMPFRGFTMNHDTNQWLMDGYRIVPDAPTDYHAKVVSIKSVASGEPDFGTDKQHALHVDSASRLHSWQNPGVLHVIAENPAWISSAGNAESITVSAEVKVVEGRFGLIGRYIDDMNYIAAMVDPALDRGYPHMIVSVVRGTRTVLASSETTGVLPLSWTKFEFVIDGPGRSMRLMADGRLIVRYSGTIPVPAGTFGFTGAMGLVRVHSFAVSRECDNVGGQAMKAGMELQKARFQCKDGYVPVDEEHTERKCGGGYWNGQPLRCRATPPLIT